MTEDDLGTVRLDPDWGSVAVRTRDGWNVTQVHAAPPFYQLSPTHALTDWKVIYRRPADADQLYELASKLYAAGVEKCVDKARALMASGWRKARAA